MGQTSSAGETRELLDAVRLLDDKLPITNIPLHVEPTLKRVLETQEAEESRAKSEKRGFFSGIKRILGSQAIEGSDLKLL